MLPTLKPKIPTKAKPNDADDAYSNCCQARWRQSPFESYPKITTKAKPNNGDDAHSNCCQAQHRINGDEAQIHCFQPQI